jgi:hypothetical protein
MQYYIIFFKTHQHRFTRAKTKFVVTIVIHIVSCGLLAIIYIPKHSIIVTERRLTWCKYIFVYRSKRIMGRVYYFYYCCACLYILSIYIYSRRTEIVSISSPYYTKYVTLDNRYTYYITRVNGIRS